MKIVFQNVVWLLSFVCYQYLCMAKSAVTIGVLLNELTSQVILPLNSVIYKKNMFDQMVYFTSNVSQVSNTDSFDASKTLCNMMEAHQGVSAVFGVDSPNTFPILESICTNFEIPFITASWKPTIIRNPDQARALLNFHPEAELYAKGLAELVKSLEWSSFVIVYETEEGLVRLQEILKLQELERGKKKNVIIVKQLGPGPDYRPLFKEIRNTTEDNIILDCKTENILPILSQAKSLNMLNLHNRYFITSLDAHTIDFTVLETTANITTVRIHDPSSDDFKNAIHRWQLTEFENRNIRMQLDPKSIKTETVLFHDAILLLSDSISDLSVKYGLDEKPISCKGNDTSINGFALRNYMRIRKPSFTLSGPISFNENGDRIKFNIYLVDMVDDTILATWFAGNKTLHVSRSYNATVDAAILNLQKIKVIVSSRIGPPYLMEREPSYEGEELVGNRKYMGYSMDLIDGIAKIIGFNYEFAITEKYGNYDEDLKKWNGLVGELLERRAHLAVCDLTITPERREVVDFSMPFMTLGISILYKKPDKKDINMFAFLDPFSGDVWIYTATLFLVISIVLYFISRMTPGDWENPHPCEDDPEELENIWDIKNCLWLTLGSIMTQGCDILPKGISSRIAVAMWWFFSLIMTSSYTANLAAFLTKANSEPPIDGAEALSKQTKIKYGLLTGGSTESFFRNSNFSTYQRMWLNMQQFRPSVFEDTNQRGVVRVNTTKNSLYAFLMESTQIEYEIETNCHLKQIGDWLDSKSYGIAMPMNSPYRGAINMAVLTMQESGALAELKQKWWKKMRKEPSCDSMDAGEDEDSGKLALANVGGVFLVLYIGLALACFISSIEFLWNVRNVSVEEHITYGEALKSELKFACNVWITKKRTKPLLSESSSSSGGSGKTDAKSIVHSFLQSAGSLMNINRDS
ncbi:glutamate receptor ionotropic, kainate 2 [Leptinotarsa decemlineata]|uniref:glutamate receptor ionotropic, kainate 2 n=1 Tax=Leptinotarsa decemlineata TaxID=7539 RepID=UPI003D30966D